MGDLPTARYYCTCSVLPSGDVNHVIVAEGMMNHGFIDIVDFFSIEILHFVS